jgi:hypothetical protein
MSMDSGPRGPLSAVIPGESAVKRNRGDHRPGRGARNRQWLVQLATGEEQVEADDVEVTVSGALVFYRLATRTESERTLLTAFSPGLWRRCELERDG